MSELIIRQAAEKDVAAIAELEKRCFADPWSYDSVYYDVVKNKLALYIVAEQPGGSSEPANAGGFAPRNRRKRGKKSYP